MYLQTVEDKTLKREDNHTSKFHLKLVFGSGFLVFVRVELQSHLSIGLLYLIIGCSLGDTENLVVVFSHT